MFLDTSGLYCSLDVKDARHRDAAALMESAPTLLTHNYVLAELVPLCNARGMNRRMTLEFVVGVANAPDVAFIWVDEKCHRSAVDLLRARPDKELLIVRCREFSSDATGGAH